MARAQHSLRLGPQKEYDDSTLARKVESEIFRDPKIPKGELNVSAVDGIVALRGQVAESDLISEIVKRTKKVEGVRDVENLLHTPRTEAPRH